MTRYLLDTNIISEATKPTPSRAVAAWLQDRIDSELFISAFVIAEMRRGILELPAGKRRNGLESWFEGPNGPGTSFAGRILAFDERAAREWARLMSEGVAGGKPRGALDMIVAATAVANACTVVTLNERHFAGVVPLFNPASDASDA